MKKLTFLILYVYVCAACAPVATPASTPSSTPQAAIPIQETPIAAPTSTPAPTAAQTSIPTPSMQMSPSDGMTKLYVRAGNVNMGALDIFAESDEKPAHLVRLDAFWIDQVEVTNGMYRLCAQAGICQRPVKINSDDRPDYFDNQEFRDYPVVYVTWTDANTYCTWAGRRLPSEAEWERAARGDDMRTFPWGGEPPNSLYANANNDLGDTSRVGSYAAGASPFGALDMAGNVWEWVADYYSPRYYAVSPETNPPGPVENPLTYDRVIRGGSYQDGQLDLRVSNRGYEIGPDPIALPGTEPYTGRSSVKIGFRCAADD